MDASKTLVDVPALLTHMWALGILLLTRQVLVFL